MSCISYAVNIPNILLNQVSNVHGHLVNLCVVEFFNVIEGTFVIIGDEVDCNSFTAKSSTTSDSN